MNVRYLRGAAAGALLLLAPALASAQHGHGHAMPADTMRGDTTTHAMVGMAGMGGMQGMTMSQGPLGVPVTRMGSGTSWLPDASPMYARHFMVGGWETMLHGVAYGYHDRQNGPRGADQWGSINWAMLMAIRPLSGGRLHLHGMFSAEPWTLGDGGYPLLLQTGETYRGRPLQDRQHPHDLFMELSALYERPISPNLAFELYAAPAGEPAVGPVAFPHRPSAMSDPLAPIGHHWEDATHVSYGVLTAGLFSRSWKVEGSVFNGREPDENRADFDFGALDSYAGRVLYNPSPSWSFSASGAYLKDAERGREHPSLRRYGVSVMHGRAFGASGRWNSALAWGANQHVGEGGLESAVFAETNLDLDDRNSVFARAEYVRKGAEDLVLGPTPPADVFDVGALSAGYARDVATLGGFGVGVGVRGSVDFVPAALEPYYGSRNPTGWAVYVRLRPKPMRMEAGTAHDSMPGMHHPTHE